ncbi:MAG: aspartate aminotransferase family protein [Spirochaetes bacterium]|jgi:acetylornithine/N-succinyldiaminopimelate aminotransferase|nr:aspartate aminotransferase family protein [Spirochaetota bacterium]
MHQSESIFNIEDKYSAPFLKKTKISIERGDGVFVYDTDGREYIDFTSGWGVACLGHSHPVIMKALQEQSGKIMQNPNSGATYSPARAALLELLSGILPGELSRLFFCNSGAEANDAAIKLARKASGKKGIISMNMSFHGRTISTASATGQPFHRDKFNPLMPFYAFVPYGDIAAVEKAMDGDTAAIILEPVQGEGGVIIPPNGYLEDLSDLCESKEIFLILDEIQTGFFRTGPAFCSSLLDLKPSFMTMAKGIAGGFPFAAIAMTDKVALKLSAGDHGGTYCGNPLGCAVSYAVIKHLIENRIEDNVKKTGDFALEIMLDMKKKLPGIISDARGKGLLLALALANGDLAEKVFACCLENGLIVNLLKDKGIIRIFPPLNISMDEMENGMKIMAAAVETAACRKEV